MYNISIRRQIKIFSRFISVSSFILSLAFSGYSQVLHHEKFATKYFQNDASWYLDNIPFFECSDQQIEQVYYYRWKMYKAHIRRVGDNKYVITEFINHVAWDREPYCTINAASMHHIYEGRWLKDNRYIDGYIDYLYQDGGNDRRYSESIADASYGRYLVNADASFLTKQLDSMKRMYNEWSDHFDSSKQLYFIPAMPDATEYTIASIDASGGKDGFDDGEAFRPTINSYMYGNAMAIARIAKLKGDAEDSQKYFRKAIALKANVEKDLWNDSLHHFTDRFKVDNQYVHYWNFIRGRELAGMIPWYFDLPSDSKKFNAAWLHLTDTSQLLGAFGFRTNEPSYQYYFKQFVFYKGQRGSQWNGPSWPYQTSQSLTAMANFINDYNQGVVTASDYIKSLRLFARQHFLPNGKLDLVENYDPNLGGPIVYYYWSNHYNHSSFNNLVITGLCGIRPTEGDTLTINPISDNSIKYFCLDGISYHGHKLTVLYDVNGTRYNYGKGITVFVDDKRASLIEKDGKHAVLVGPPVVTHYQSQPPDYALNIFHSGFPKPSASVNANPDSSLYQAIDGRIWYFSAITNYWSTKGSPSSKDWYALDFGKDREISTVNLYLYSDAQTFGLPDAVSILCKHNGNWDAVKMNKGSGNTFLANTENKITFDKITADGIKIFFQHKKKQVAVSEIECY